MNRYIQKVSRHWKRLLLLTLAVALTQCITLDSIDQPSFATAGEELIIKIRPKISPHPNAAPENNVRLVIGFLAPRNWNATQNTTMSYTSNRGNGTMRLVPESARPAGSALEWSAAMMGKVGIGGNLVKDLVWVAFWSDQTYNISPGSPEINAEVTIKTKPGMQNMVVQLGYFIASTNLALTDANAWDVIFPEPIEVSGGEDPFIDYTRPQLTLIDPLENTDNDILTLTFDGSVVPTALDDAEEVFLCATGYTADNTAFVVCGREEKSKMKSIGENQWQMDLWPRQYFDLPEDQALQRLEYSFTNSTGDSTVLDAGSGKPFAYQFGCE